MAKNTTRHGVPDPGPEPGDYEGATWDGKHWIREGQVVKAGPWDNTSTAWKVVIVSAAAIAILAISWPLAGMLR
jgi:hypothetical protein